jgi:hypothetical protein
LGTVTEIHHLSHPCHFWNQSLTFPTSLSGADEEIFEPGIALLTEPNQQKILKRMGTFMRFIFTSARDLTPSAVTHIPLSIIQY